MLSIQEFLKKINTGSAVRENIPMGLGMGFPVLNITGDRLLVSVFTIVPCCGQMTRLC